MCRNMLCDVVSDDRLPTLDMENLPAPQPMADANRDADQHSSDEIMEPRKDAVPRAEDCEALRVYRRFILQRNQHPKCIRDTCGSMSVRLTLLCGFVWESLCAPNRSTKEQSSRELSRC